MIIEAAIPARLSAPAVSKMSVRIAVDALPEIGRINKNGASPSGILSFSRSNAMGAVIPQFENIAMAQKSRQRVGNRSIAVVNPRLAPMRKASNNGFFEVRIKIPQRKTIAGIIPDEIVSIRSDIFGNSAFFRYIGKNEDGSVDRLGGIKSLSRAKTR